MIFAEIKSSQSYYDLYPELLEVIEGIFENVQSGVQGDAWIWVEQGDEKVALDTFSSMQFQIKSTQPSSILLKKVISELEKRFDLIIYPQAIIEGHDDIESHKGKNR